MNLLSRKTIPLSRLYLMLTRIFTIVVILLCFAKTAFCEEKIGNELFSPKTPTPTRLFSADLSMPEKFNTTNNLVQKTGSFYAAFGEIIYVQGTITDSFRSAN